MLRGNQSREVLINVRGAELIAREFSQFQASDMAGQTDSSESMNYITRDEFSARIEVIETRIDARIESMSAKIDGFLTQQAERDKVRLEQEQSQEAARLELEATRLERERSQEAARLERERSQEKVRLEQEQARKEARLERERTQEEVRLTRERYLEDFRQEQERIRLAREKANEKAWLEREKTEQRIRLAQEKVHQERDKRYALMTARMDRSLERIDEAMRMVSTNKANYWAATTVHFLGMVAILVGSYYANQANVLVTMQTTLAMVQSVKEAGNSAPAVLMTLPAE
ncbi:hypothetical protein PMI24_03487 [Pseudomonas sp. GM25]|nr:hypothetical protein PMI24_03487 [Pseudomonas sp. GM25]